MAHVYTAAVCVRHHELDATGRVHAADYLRWLAQAAIDASAAAGFDAAWYRASNAMWLVRRSTFEVVRALRVDERATIATWVEDFRRVRSYRRYEVRDATGASVARGLTDWVYVEALSGKPRRIPDEMGAGFGVDAAAPGPARPTWTAPAEPAGAVRTPLHVRWSDLDSLAHVNNAAYLDLATDAVLDAFARAGWPLDRLMTAGLVPLVVGGDLEYVDAARYGDDIVARTWMTVGVDAIDVHQCLGKADGNRLYVRANSTWRFAALDADEARAVPAALRAALAPLGGCV